MADVGSINYKSEKTEFLDDKTIKSIKDSIKSGITNITESLVTVIDDESGNGLSEESFNVDGEGIIYNKSQEIKKDIESFTDKSSDFSNVLKTIEDHGHAHMAEEAEKWKKERKKHYNELIDYLKSDVTTYNNYVSFHNQEERLKQSNSETPYTPVIKERLSVYKDKNDLVKLSGEPSSQIQHYKEVKASLKNAVDFYPKYKESVEYYDQLKGRYGDYFASSNILTRVFATSGNLVVAFTSGILKFNEGIDDMGLFVKGHCKSALKHFLGEIAEDFGFEEKGSKLKKEGNKIKEQYNKEILIDHTQETLDRFYENTKAGKWLDRNSYISHDSTAYQFVSVAGQAVPTVATAAILTAISGGTAAPGVVTALGATLGGSTALGQTAESHYQKTGGKDTVGGYLKMAGFTALGALGGGGEAQAGAKIGTNLVSKYPSIAITNKIPDGEKLLSKIDDIKSTASGIPKKAKTTALKGKVKVADKADDFGVKVSERAQKMSQNAETKIDDIVAKSKNPAKQGSPAEILYGDKTPPTKFEKFKSSVKSMPDNTNIKYQEGKIKIANKAEELGGKISTKAQEISKETNLKIDPTINAKNQGSPAEILYGNKNSAPSTTNSDLYARSEAIPQTQETVDHVKGLSAAREKIEPVTGKIREVSNTVKESKPVNAVKTGVSEMGSNIKTGVSNKVDDLVTGTKEAGHKVYDATIGRAENAAEKTSDLFSWVRNKTTSKSQTGGEDIDDYLSGINNQTDEVGNGANSFFDN